MTPADLDALRKAVRDVPDFPKPGIVFKDITPALGDGRMLRKIIDGFVEATRPLNVSKVVGIESRGFIFGTPLAAALGVGFVPVRKKGKLPWECEAISYALEYGEATVEIHRDAVESGERVVLIDDLLATGGTAAAAVALVQKLGGVVAEAQFLIELSFLGGRRLVPETAVRSFLTF
ncbi:MAG TPA: adenine phosphoribosyltransferase [Chthoniobacteraceae bacterium]|nr:adenine phosphoribosyltransferase [Chthoniobacteraceae bacterium]